MMRRIGWMVAALLLAAGAPGAAGAAGAGGEELARAADELYRQGSYSAALRKLEEAMAAGHQSPAVLYQAANCYRAVMSDTGREVELKKKAVPLLESEIAAGRAGIESHYYLASIYIHSLADPVKGVEVARKGIALVEKPDPALRRPVENLYRAARLYEFLGKDAEAAAMDRDFLKDAGVSAVPADRAAVRISREKLGAHYMRAGKNLEAAEVLAALVKADPVRDAERHQWGLALLRAGDPEGAAAAWRGAVGDEYRTELAYLEKVATRYAQAGRPTSSKLAPDAASLTDEALGAKLIDAGAALREYKSKAEAEAKAERDGRVAEADRKREEIERLSAEERAARWEAFKKRKKPTGEPAGGSAPAGGGDESSEALKLAGLPVKSEAWQAAERDFFFLLVEYVKRGHLIRMYAFQNGLSDLIFR